MKKNLLLLFVIFPVTFLLAGNPGNNEKGPSERSLFKQAERYYVKKDYESAIPLYKQLVASHSDNYRLNYGYGICLLISSKDKAEALRYLQEASKSSLVMDDVWYYLGRAYQLNEDFDNSIVAYSRFLRMVGVKQSMKWEAMHQIEMCQNALVLSSKPDSLTFLELKPISQDEVNGAYHFDGDNGSFIPTPDEFKTARDNKNSNCSQAFVSVDGMKMVFASYGRESSPSLDIFMVEKNEAGKWGKPVRLSTMINTSYDDAFPTLSEDGTTLYFSSKGHNSMGGYDIFSSVYYPQTRQWSKPENMGVPINSPNNDFYFVPSESENSAYFSSLRGCNSGEVMVYKIQLNNSSVDALIISGEVINEYTPPIRQARIKITRAEDESLITEFSSDPVNGKFRYTLPVAANYRIAVKVEGFSQMAQRISFSKDAKGKLYQTIRVSKDSLGYEHIQILNTFQANAIAAKRQVSDVQPEAQTQPIVETQPEMETEAPSEENQTLSTGFEPITMYSVSGLPPVSEDSKEKLKKYFSELHQKDEQYEDHGIIDIASSTERGTTYRVQIGTFMHQTIEMVYNKLQEMGFEDVSYYTNKKGWIIFYTGHGKEIASTLKLKELVIRYGFEDAFITVFQNGKPSRATTNKK